MPKHLGGSATHCGGDYRLSTALACVVFLVCTSCAVLGPIKGQVPRTARAALEALDDGHEDVTGVIHIHTVYSDGGGTFEDVARVANQQKLNYLIVTDHNTLRPLREGKQGWYGMTLVCVGTELSTRGGHLLVLNVREEITRHQPTQAVIDEVNRQGGLSFIAHPYFKRRRWTDWTVHGVTGIEGYNVAHDSLDENRLRIALWSVAVPADPLFLSMLDRPYDPMAKWDELLKAHGKVVGIGASDAHEIRILGLKVAPYEIMFKLIRTHLLIPAGASLSEPTLYEALRLGHAYFSIDLVADATAFTFMADDTRRVLGIMGDEVTMTPHLQLTAVLPAAGELSLFKDGATVATSSGRVWQIPVTEPGTFRLEASRDGKPWIFSNPIYVRTPAAPEEQPVTEAQSDAEQ